MWQRLLPFQSMFSLVEIKAEPRSGGYGTR